MVNAHEVLSHYDWEMRQDPFVAPGVQVERVGGLVRLRGSYNCILYSRLGEGEAPGVVREQAEFFRRAHTSVEWKVFGHDGPAQLETLLSEQGFRPGPPETLVAFDLTRDSLPPATVPGVEIRRVTGEAGVQDSLEANVGAFGEEARRSSAEYAGILRAPDQALYVAYAQDRPVASARVELPPHRSFAGLYGGGTIPAFRHRGIYRAMVGARGALAKGLGYRYLTVDAQESSRPILEQLGFFALARTRAWVLEVPSGQDQGDPAGQA